MSWTAVREVFPYERITYKHIKGFATGMDVTLVVQADSGTSGGGHYPRFSLSWPLLGDFVSRYIVGPYLSSRLLQEHCGISSRLSRSGQIVGRSAGGHDDRGRQRRFVITGIGAVTPIGLWSRASGRVLRGKSAVRECRRSMSRPTAAR